MPLSFLSSVRKNNLVVYKPPVAAIPLTITATGITIANNTASYPNTTNYTYYVVSPGTGTIKFSKAVTVQVFATGGGGGGGGNNAAAGGPSTGAGGGGGSGAFYFNSSITMNTSTINVTVGSGGTAGVGQPSSSGGPGGTGGATTISGGSFPNTITLNGGVGGYGGTTTSTSTTTFTTSAGFGGLGGTQTNGTYAGVSGGNGGKPSSWPSGRGYANSTANNYALMGLTNPWAGSVIINGARNVIYVTLGDRAAYGYCCSGPGGNGLGQASNGGNPGSAPNEGGGGNGGNGATAGARNGLAGGNGTIIFVVPINA